MFKRLKRRPSPTFVIASVALFVALGGPGYAATGGGFVLGSLNTATSPTSLTASGAASTSGLSVTNSNNAAGATALALNVPAGHAPMTVNRSTKVVSLNADWLDGLDSSTFLRKGALATVSVNGAGGVVDVNNPGTGNGVRGRTSSTSGSGVYGENMSGGAGVAGRASTGNAIYGESTGRGYAGYFAGDVAITGGLSCDGCVNPTNISGSVANATNAADAERVDGASIVSNRIVGGTAADHILDLPGFGHFYVDSCEDDLARIGWVSDGLPAANVTWHDLFNIDEPTYLFADNVTGQALEHSHAIIQLARDTGVGAEIAEVTITAHASDCSFAGQAVVQPG